MQYQIIKIPSVKTNKSGQLSFFEGERNIPFQIKRIYYIAGVHAGEKRGAHAHKSLKQFLFCPYGSVTVILNDGQNEENVILDDPNLGLLLFPGLWRDIVWNVDLSVLCVAVSDFFSEDDYIRDFKEYKKFLEAK